MADAQDALKQFIVRPGERFRFKDHPSDWLPDALKGLDKVARKAASAQLLATNIAELAEVQDLLFADNRHSLLIVFQAMDAAGKDSTIKHVMSGVNPQGCNVTSFKVPSREELDHDFLWRFAKQLPARGMIGIFNRSYYENVLVEKVHPELLEASQLPRGSRGRTFWRQRYQDINGFEKHLVNSGTVVVKFFLNVSSDEQRARFLQRLDMPDKHWKFSPNDLVERQRWDEYQEAYAEAINATSTRWAPWFVIPADRKWAMRVAVSDIIVATLRKLKMEYPRVSEADMASLAEARAVLEAEIAAEAAAGKVYRPKNGGVGGSQ